MVAQRQVHILVLEDDAQYRRLVTRMLEAADFRVTSVEAPSAALSIIDGDEHIDLLLADVGMPAGAPHGLSIGKMAQLRRGRLKVIYMSGSDLGQFALFQGESMVRKPFTSEELIAAVKTALG
jgi:CheY-like chemotaxis protein